MAAADAAAAASEAATVSDAQPGPAKRRAQKAPQQASDAAPAKTVRKRATQKAVANSPVAFSAAQLAAQALHSPGGPTEPGAPQRPLVLLGIDPDTSGAMAVVQWQASGAAQGGAAGLPAADIDVYDMPTMRVETGTRARNQTDAAALTVLLKNVLPGLPPGAQVLAVLEEPVCNSLNGKHSWWSTGFAYGVWTGVMRALGIDIQTISARRWKLDMGLNGKGKDGSRELAVQLFPQSADLLKRKKDHGRAEALLIAAWAAHMRPQILAGEPVVPDDLVGEASLDPLFLAVSAEGAPSEAAEVAGAPAKTLHADALSSEEQRRLRPAADKVVRERSTQSAPTMGHTSQQAPGRATSAANERQPMHTEAEAAAEAAPLTAAEVAARIEAVKRRMIANAAPSQVESMATFLQTLQR